MSIEHGLVGVESARGVNIEHCEGTSATLPYREKKIMYSNDLGEKVKLILNHIVMIG